DEKQDFSSWPNSVLGVSASGAASARVVTAVLLECAGARVGVCERRTRRQKTSRGHLALRQMMVSFLQHFDPPTRITHDFYPSVPSVSAQAFQKTAQAAAATAAAGGSGRARMVQDGSRSRRRASCLAAKPRFRKLERGRIFTGSTKTTTGTTGSKHDRGCGAASTKDLSDTGPNLPPVLCNPTITLTMAVATGKVPMTAEMQQLANDPNFVIEFAIGDPVPDLVPQSMDSGIRMSGVYFDETRRYIMKSCHLSKEDVADRRGHRKGGHGVAPPRE
ncbi:hypothetical protein THAOC_18036, partial [Thalassiosira oceanica]